MLRRIALAITLITGSLQAEDPTLRDPSECEEQDQGPELTVHADGTIASWSLLRLVLPDLADEIDGAEWIETAVRAGPRERLSLDTLVGRAVTSPSGAAIGIVRGCLVNPVGGRVLALDVDLGPMLSGESRRVVLPWADLEVAGGSIRYIGDVESAPPSSREL